MNRPKLRKYQIEGVCQIQKFGGRALLADDMGLGKTCQALVWLERAKKFPVVVVCPSAVKCVWEKEAMLWAGKSSAVCYGRTPRAFVGSPEVVVVNYDILPHWWEFILETVKPQTIIFDECQAIKNRDAQRTKAAKKMSKRAPHIVCISGTPLESRPSELWSALNILRPDEYKSFMAYAFKYCAARKTSWGWEYKGCTNANQLNEELRAKLMIRRRKVDVAKELPSKSRSVVPFQLTAGQAREYDMAETQFLTWLAQNTGAAAAASAAKAVQITRMNALKRLAAKMKLDQVFEWIDTFLDSTDRKLILFAVHTDVLEALVKRYSGISVSISGATPSHKRGEVVEQFQRSPKVRLFVGQLRAAGAGITLTAASDVAFVELGWVPAEHLQAEDRPHRIGQENPVMIHYLVAKNTMEESLCRILQEKQQVLSAILDGGNGDEIQVYDQLISGMQKQETVR